MSPFLMLALGATIFAARHVGAQNQTGTVQAEWIFPQIPDYSDTLYVGQAYTLQWTSNLKDSFSYFCPACDTSNVALYASGGLDDSEVWQINSGISVQATTQLQWVVDIPASQLADSVQWNLQFVPSGTKPSSFNQQISSPRIFIRPANVTSTTTSGSSTPTSTPTSTSTTTNTSTGLSTGAKAGIGIGAALGGLAVIGAIVFGFIFAKRRNNRARASSNAEAERTPALGGASGGQGEPPSYYEPKTTPQTPYNDAGAPYGFAGELPVKRPTAGDLQGQQGPQELEHHIPMGELEANPVAPQELPASSRPQPQP